MKRDIIYFIVIIAMFLLAGFFATKWRASEAKSDRMSSVIAEKNDSITYYKNQFGQVVSEKNVAVLEAKELKATYPKIVEDIEKRMNLKFKDIKAYVSNEFAVRGSGTGSVNNHYHYDSGANKNCLDSSNFKMDDGFLKFENTFYANKSQSEYVYEYKDRAQTAFASDYRWYRPFRKERITAKTVFDNPNAKVTNTTNILTTEYKDRRWVISVGGYYDPVRGNYGLGITGGYALFKF